MDPGGDRRAEGGGHWPWSLLLRAAEQALPTQQAQAELGLEASR